MSDQLFPRISFEPITREELNTCLRAWRHHMGPLSRPTMAWAHGLRCNGDLTAVVSADILIQPRVAGFSRRQAIEVSRLCAARPDLCRVALRLWRSFVFPYLCSERGCRSAVSYQDAIEHSDNLYRFDGWVRVGRSRSGGDPRTGRKGRKKVIWGWCDDPVERRCPGRQDNDGHDDGRAVRIDMIEPRPLSPPFSLGG